MTDGERQEKSGYEENKPFALFASSIYSSMHKSKMSDAVETAEERTIIKGIINGSSSVCGPQCTLLLLVFYWTSGCFLVLLMSGVFRSAAWPLAVAVKKPLRE